MATKRKKTGYERALESVGRQLKDEPNPFSFRERDRGLQSKASGNTPAVAKPIDSSQEHPLLRARKINAGADRVLKSKKRKKKK